MHPHRQSCEELGRWQGRKCSVVSLQNYCGLHRNLRGRGKRLGHSRVESKSHASQPLGLSHEVSCSRGEGLIDRQARMQKNGRQRGHGNSKGKMGRSYTKGSRRRLDSRDGKALGWNRRRRS